MARLLKLWGRAALVAIFTVSFAYAGTASAQTPSDADIRKAMIEESISRYSGACACPYSRKSNGHRCGGNSAYSKPGGKSPLCFARDISDQMVEAYRARKGLVASVS